MICAICLDSKPGSQQTLSCGHVYHDYCIVLAYSTDNKSCPTCRKPIVEPLKDFPVHAVKSNTVDFVRRYIGAGADVRTNSHWGDSNPLVLAVNASAVEVLDMLIRSMRRNYSEVSQSSIANLVVEALKRASNGTILHLIDSFRVDLACIPETLQVWSYSDVSFLNKLLHHGASTTSCPCISRAVTMGCIDAVSVLLNKGADINSYTSTVPPAIFGAIESEQFDIIPMLLDRGAHVNILWQNRTPLSACVKHTDTVRLLLDHKACKTMGNPLMKAIESETDESVRVLVAAGARITPFHIQTAARLGSSSIVRLLLHNCEDKRLGECALFIPETPINVLRTLLECGVDVNAVNPSTGEPALNYNVSLCSMLEVLHVFSDHGVNFNAVDREGMNALMCHVWRQRNIHVLEFLLRRIDVNCVDRTNISPLFLACVSGYSDAVRLLLRKGARWDVCDAPGANVVWYAICGLCNGLDIDLISQFIDMGVDVKASGGLLLNSAVKSLAQKDGDIIVRMVKLGARLNTGSKYHTLATAVERHTPNVVEALFQAGGCCVHQFPKKFDPLVLAIKNDQTSMVSVLLKHGAMKYPTRTKRNPISHSKSLRMVRLLVEQGGASLTGCDISAWPSTLLKRVLGSDLPIDIADRFDSLPFIWSMVHDEGLVRLSIERGASVNYTDTKGVTVLIHALTEQVHSCNIVNMLVTNGTDVSTVSYGGKSPLCMILEESKCSRCTLLLLENGARADTNLVGTQSLINMGISQNNVEVIRALIDAGAETLSVRQDLKPGYSYISLEIARLLYSHGSVPMERLTLDVNVAGLIRKRTYQD